MAFLGVIQHLHELAVTLVVDFLWLTYQVLQILLLPQVKKLVDLDLLLLESLIANAVDQLEILNDRLAEGSCVATVFFVRVGLPRH